MLSPASQLPTEMDYEQRVVKSGWTEMALCLCQLTTVLMTKWPEIADQQFPWGNVWPKRNSKKHAVSERATWKRKILREVREPVPWVMWWACLPGDDEFNRVPTALAVLHQDGHWIFPTRQGAGQWLARSLYHPCPFHATRPKNSPNVFDSPLTDSRRDKFSFH